MTTRTLEVSDELYQQLNEQAERLQLTPEQLIEQLLAADLSLLTDLPEDDDLPPVPPAGSPEALAAVERLKHTFAGLDISFIDQILDDPMLDLENSRIVEPCAAR